MSTEQVIEESARCVYNDLGPGHSEYAYHKALEVELTHRGRPHSSESTFPIYYRGTPVSYRKPDLFVDNSVIVELKSGTISSKRADGAEQMRSYLRLGEDDDNMEIDAAMLIIFGNDDIEVIVET